MWLLMDWWGICHKPDASKMFFCYSDLSISSSCSVHTAIAWDNPARLCSGFSPSTGPTGAVLHAFSSDSTFLCQFYCLLCLTTIDFIPLINWTRFTVFCVNPSSVALLIILYTLTEMLNKVVSAIKSGIAIITGYNQTWCSQGSVFILFSPIFCKLHLICSLLIFLVELHKRLIFSLAQNAKVYAGDLKMQSLYLNH